MQKSKIIFLSLTLPFFREINRERKMLSREHVQAPIVARQRQCTYTHISGFYPYIEIVSPEGPRIDLYDVFFKSIIPFNYLTHSSCNWKLHVFLCLPFVTSWKYFVLEYPSNSSFTFALWYHFISSSLNIFASVLFSHCLKFISSHVRSVDSAFLFRL